MHHAPALVCGLCEIEVAELYCSEHGREPPSRDRQTMSETIEHFKTEVSLMPICRYDELPAEHHSKHFTAVMWRKKQCRPGCSTCELCCRERALRQYLGDEEFYAECEMAALVSEQWADDPCDDPESDCGNPYHDHW